MSNFKPDTKTDPSIPLTKKWRDSVKGELEVTPARTSEIGATGQFAHPGDIGYVRKWVSGKCLVQWPWLGLYGVHDAGDLDPTGKRG